jgi:short subunit dehydrogenase-like uncharacterized protein
MSQPQPADALNAFKNLSLGQKLLAAVFIVVAFAFVWYMNFMQKSNDQEQFRTYYQSYTEKADAIVTSVEQQRARKGVSTYTTVTFTTAEGEEMTTPLPGINFVAAEGSSVQILYIPDEPYKVVTVEEYTSRTGLPTP